MEKLDRSLSSHREQANGERRRSSNQTTGYKAEYGVSNTGGMRQNDRVASCEQSLSIRTNSKGQNRIESRGSDGLQTSQATRSVCSDSSASRLSSSESNLSIAWQISGPVEPFTGDSERCFESQNPSEHLSQKSPVTVSRQLHSLQPGMLDDCGRAESSFLAPSVAEIEYVARAQIQETMRCINDLSHQLASYGARIAAHHPGACSGQVPPLSGSFDYNNSLSVAHHRLQKQLQELSLLRGSLDKSPSLTLEHHLMPSLTQPVPTILSPLDRATWMNIDRLASSQYTSQSCGQIFDLFLPAGRQLPSPNMLEQQQMPAEEGTADLPKIAHKQQQSSTKPKLTKPKRPLTAYNVFFRENRLRLLAEHSPDVTFEGMGKAIGNLWKDIDQKERKRYDAAAAEDKKRYKRELALYKERKEDELEAKRQALELTVPDSVKQKYFLEHQDKKRRMS